MAVRASLVLSLPFPVDRVVFVSALLLARIILHLSLLFDFLILVLPVLILLFSLGVGLVVFPLALLVALVVFLLPLLLQLIHSHDFIETLNFSSVLFIMPVDLVTQVHNVIKRLLVLHRLLPALDRLA